MIYTLTLNPSLDYLMHIHQLSLKETNRSYAEAVYAGGKGINVSMMLSILGYPSILFGFVAGFTGNEIERQLCSSGMQTDFIHLNDGMSRINVKLKHGDETEINASGPDITPSALQELYQKLDRLCQDDWLIISGSIPASISVHQYENMVRHVQNRHVKIIVDTSGDALRKALPYHPFLIKPNLHEVEELFQITIHTKDDVIFYGKKLQAEGAKNVLISCAKQGAVLVTEHGDCYTCSAANGETINSVGSGDAMVAGFLAGYLQTHRYDDALRLGSAAGGASAFEEHWPSSDQILHIQKQLMIEKT